MHMKASGFVLAWRIALARRLVVFIRLSKMEFLKSAVNRRRGLRTFSPATFTAAKVSSGIPLSAISFYVTDFHY